MLGPDLRRLLEKACGIGARRADLSDATLKNYKYRLEARLDRLMARAPTPPAGVKLAAMIKRTRRVPDQPRLAGDQQRLRAGDPALRDLPQGHILFSQPLGTELYADIRSVIETGRRRAIDALEAIHLTFAGKPLAPPVPS